MCIIRDRSGPIRACVQYLLQLQPKFLAHHGSITNAACWHNWCRCCWTAGRCCTAQCRDPGRTIRDTVAITNKAVLQTNFFCRLCNLQVVLFEKSSNVGGVWQHNYAGYSLQVGGVHHASSNRYSPMAPSRSSLNPQAQAQQMWLYEMSHCAL